MIIIDNSINDGAKIQKNANLPNRLSFTVIKKGPHFHAGPLGGKKFGD